MAFSSPLFYCSSCLELLFMSNIFTFLKGVCVRYCAFAGPLYSLLKLALFRQYAVRGA